MMSDEMTIWMPKSFADKLRSQGPREIVKFVLDQWYDKSMEEALAFEEQVKFMSESQVKVNAMMLNGMIPPFVYHAIRVIDRDFWKRQENYDIFFGIFKKGKINDGRIRVTT